MYHDRRFCLKSSYIAASIKIVVSTAEIKSRLRTIA